MSSRTTSAGQPAAGTRAGQLGRFEEIDGRQWGTKRVQTLHASRTLLEQQQGRGHSLSVCQTLSCLRLALVKGGFTGSCPTLVFSVGCSASRASGLLFVPFFCRVLQSPVPPDHCATALLLGQCEIAGQPRRVGMTMAGHERTAN
jgi:hypothetical protein